MIIWEVVFPRYFTFIKNHPQNFVNRRSYTDEKTLLNMSIMNQSQWPLGLCRRSTADRLLGSWVRIPPRHGCPSVVSVVCCQVEVTATSWSPVQRSLAERGVWVWSWSLDNEEALAHCRLLLHRKKYQQLFWRTYPVNPSIYEIRFPRC